MTNPATLAHLRQSVIGSIRKIGREMTDPEADWTPVLITQDPSGMIVEPIPFAWFENGREKDLISAAIKATLATRGVYRYALVLTSYVVMLDVSTKEGAAAGKRLLRDVRAEKIKVADQPGRKELLVLTIGDAETEELWTAEIVRFKTSPPKLLPFEHWTGEDASFSGRFTGLNEALR